MHPLGRGPDRAVVRGHKELRDWVDSVTAIDELHFDATHYTTAGQFVVARVRVRAQQSGTATPLDVPVVQVFELTEGRIQRLSTYLDDGQTLGAVGLRE